MLTEAAFTAGSLCVVGNINRDLKTAPLRPGDHLFQDGLGHRLERTLRQHRVRAHLAKDPQHATGTSIALAFESGHRHFISCLPASQSLRFEDLDPAGWAGCDHLLRADVWFSEAMLFEGNQALFKAAHQAGLAVSLDLNWDPLWGAAPAAVVQSRKQAVRALLPWVHLVHGNARELTEFAGTTELETALDRLTDWGAQAVVMHLGDRGAGYYSGRHLTVQPPAPVARQVNSAGTGDVLSVCLMLLHAQPDRPISERLRLANAIVSEFIEGQRSLIPQLSD
jgi:sugar/nucleoside kinase (ribokinase family)